jgi:hypothetical protein
MKQHRETAWMPYFNCSATDAGINAMREGNRTAAWYIAA